MRFAGRVLLGGYLLTTGTLLGIVVVRLWDIDDELTKIKRLIVKLDAELDAAGDLATGQLP